MQSKEPALIRLDCKLTIYRNNDLACEAAGSQVVLSLVYLFGEPQVHETLSSQDSDYPRCSGVSVPVVELSTAFALSTT